MSGVALAIVSTITVIGSGTWAYGRAWVAQMRGRHALRDVIPLTATTVDGVVARVTGTVRIDGKLLVAPLSGLPCVAFRTVLQSANVRRSPAAPAAHSAEMASFTSFVLATELGTIRVEGSDALLVGRRIKFRGAPPRLAQTMLANGWNPLTQRNTRYTEQVLELGATVEVAGFVMRDVADAPQTGEQGFRDGPPTVITLAGDAKHPLRLIAQ